MKYQNAISLILNCELITFRYGLNNNSFWEEVQSYFKVFFNKWR